MAAGFTKIDLGREYAAGVNMPAGSGDALKLARANAAGTNLEYVAATSAVTADDTLATALAPNLRGAGLTVDSSGNLALRARPRRWSVSDHFMSANVTSGQIGREGWSFFASNSGALSRSAGSGTLSATNKLTLTTDTTTNDYAAIGLGSLVNSNICVLSEIQLMQFAIELPALTTRRVSVGFHDNLSVDPQTDAASLGLVYDSSVGANWLIGARNSSTGSYADSGVAVTTAGVLVSLVNNSSGTSWDIYLGNTSLGTINTNTPTGFVSFGCRVETLAGSAASVRLGYIGVETAPTGVYDDDTFLDA